MSQGTCETCSAFLALQPNKGVCRAHPPHAAVVLIPRGSVQPTLEPANFTAWPTVESDKWCREYEFRSTLELAS